MSRSRAPREVNKNGADRPRASNVPRVPPRLVAVGPCIRAASTDVAGRCTWANCHLVLLSSRAELHCMRVKVIWRQSADGGASCACCLRPPRQPIPLLSLPILSPGHLVSWLFSKSKKKKKDLFVTPIEWLGFCPTYIFTSGRGETRSIEHLDT